MGLQANWSSHGDASCGRGSSVRRAMKHPFDAVLTRWDVELRPARQFCAPRMSADLDAVQVDRTPVAAKQPDVVHPAAVVIVTVNRPPERHRPRTGGGNRQAVRHLALVPHPTAVDGISVQERGDTRIRPRRASCRPHRGARSSPKDPRRPTSCDRRRPSRQGTSAASSQSHLSLACAPARPGDKTNRRTSSKDMSATRTTDTRVNIRCQPLRVFTRRGQP